MTTKQVTALQDAQHSLHEAARQFSEAPTVDVGSRFTDLALRRAAIGFTRELLVALLGFHNSDLEAEIDELMHLAELSLKARGGIQDKQLAKQFREYRDRWNLSRARSVSSVST